VGVVFPKLSKLLNQEDALSVPCLHGGFCSPQTRPRGAAGMLRKGVIRRCHMSVCYTQAIMLTSADVGVKPSPRKAR